MRKFREYKKTQVEAFGATESYLASKVFPPTKRGKMKYRAVKEIQPYYCEIYWTRKDFPSKVEKMWKTEDSECELYHVFGI